MSFSTLSYNQEEASNIVSQITTSGTFLHTPSEELRTRDFEKDLRRHTALDLHSITLAEYHKVQRIPRGLRVPLRPTLFQDNSEYCGKFEAILNKCSMDLMVLTIDFLQKEITELNSKIVSTEQQLRSTSSPEDFKSLKDKVDKSISDLRESLQTRKRNKFLRDTEDYRNNQVYKWQFSTYSRYRRPVRRDYSPFSTSSESDFGSSRPAFLEQRPGRGHRGKRGGGNGHGQEQRRMATRSQLDQELHRFFRNVRLKAHFSKILPASAALPDQSSSTFTLNDLNLRLRSSFQPPHVYHPVETYIEFVKNDVKKVLESIQRGDYHIKHNLTVEEKQALSSLRDNRQIIIKPADKGGSIVVLDRDYYMGEIRTQLNDSDTYHPISHNPTLEISKEIKDLVSYYTSKGIIDTKLGEFLIKQYPVIPVFYTLPKIHKHPSKPPGRPIVASTESLLSPLAITLEKILSPLVPKIKSYLKDTTDFLISLKNVRKLPSNCLLVTMDVNSLYTSIRHSDGIESVMSFLSRHTTFSDLQLKFCKDLLTMVLTRNFFIFEDQFFIQKRGTAMGSNMAPPYANIFMDQFEITYVYPHSNFVSNIAYWRRYIDDVFLIWTGDVDSLLQFHTDLNSSVPGLTFSLLYDHNSMNFLDTRVNIDDNRNIETDLYVKSTDKNSLLKFESCHPHHIKRALPKSQHDRVNRIVSNPEVSHLRHQEMDAKFRARGYPDHVLIPTREMFRPDLPSKVPRLAFVSTFHPFNSFINKCILQHWDILKNAYPQVKEFNVNPIICNKRCSNIKDYVVRADVGPSTYQRHVVSGRGLPSACALFRQFPALLGPLGFHPISRRMSVLGPLNRKLLHRISANIFRSALQFNSFKHKSHK
ncbi:unnamed protein product [Ranitomeya imitator]|uniref:Reverse transcriptase domain-containing protein n=1 Tax=Ranitomeya imitator TaxID=111125 RepID=A0ABN9L969_9NEOB|nr:unnamed protein product [Ranitomeya imitator]